MNVPVSSFSTRQLGLIFVVLLLLFSLFRWDVNAWLSSKVDALIERQQLHVSYADMELSMGGLVFTGVDIQLPMKKLSFDRLEISPAWAVWARMKWGVKLIANNDFLAGSIFISRDNEHFYLNDVDMQVDVGGAQTWLAQPLPVTLHGDIRLQSSELVLDKRSGIPLSGHVEVNWNKAEVLLAKQVYPLGDYKSQIDMLKQELDWSITGGDDLLLDGQGKLGLAQKSLVNASLVGDVAIKLDIHSPLKQLLPFHSQHIHLTGSLRSPQWQLNK